MAPYIAGLDIGQSQNYTEPLRRGVRGRGFHRLRNDNER